VAAAAGFLSIACKSPPAEQQAPSPAPPSASASTAQVPHAPLAPPADVAAPSANAQKTASGLATKVLHAGAGSTHPVENQLFTITYAAWKRDGAPYSRLDDVMLTLGQLAPGWSEGVELMVPGESRRLWIPAALSGAAGADLTVDATLVSIGRKTEPESAIRAAWRAPLRNP
jgi:peptidylprolyl isomerase